MNYHDTSVRSTCKSKMHSNATFSHGRVERGSLPAVINPRFAVLRKPRAREREKEAEEKWGDEKAAR